jgi:hypothetical protein
MLLINKKKKILLYQDLAVLNKLCCIWVLWILFSPMGGWAQQSVDALKKPITLTKKTYTIQSLSLEMNKKAGFAFSYNPQLIKPNTPITISRKNTSVSHILKDIKRSTGIDYKIISNHVVYEPTKAFFKKNKPSVQRVKQGNKNASTSPVASPILVNTAPPKTITILDDKDSSASETAVLIGDSATVVQGYANLSAGGGYGGSGGYVNEATQKYPTSLAKDPTDFDDISFGNRVNTRSKKTGNSIIFTFLQKQALMQIALNADDTYWINLQGRLGFTFLYAHAGYSINQFQDIRYGLGSQIKVSDNAYLTAEFSYGKKFNKDYNIVTYDTTYSNDTFKTPIITTTETPLRVTGKIWRLQLGFQYQLSAAWGITAALCYNKLDVSYTSNNKLVSLQNLLPIGYDAEAKYPLLNPIYTLSNSYKPENPMYTKTWVGLSIGITYKFNP